MDRILEYKVTDKDAGIMLLDFLKQNSFSRHLITHLKQTKNGLSINGQWAYVNDILKPDDIVRATIMEVEGSDSIVAIDIPISVIYEDEDIILINKPANMPVHPSINNYDNTLANALAWYYRNEKSPFVFRCINRLDRDTTGLVLIAKNLYSSCVLSEMVRKREIHRTYMAVVDGIISQSGMVDAPIARKENSCIERCVDFINGQRAVTHYEPVLSCNGNTQLKITLETGRTHQIRVHMKYINHPLFGDFIYNPDFTKISRQSLHSYSLSFKHPLTGEELSFFADIPDDMKKIMSVQ